LCDALLSSERPGVGTATLPRRQFATRLALVSLVRAIIDATDVMTAPSPQLVSADGAWRLVHASDPMLTRDRPATLQEIENAAGEPAGPHVFELQSAAAFDPGAHAGRRVEARGLLYHSPEGNRLSLSSMQPVAAACQR
jgi:hypothetical protein